MDSNDLSRRTFIKNSAAATAVAVAAPAVLNAKPASTSSPNEKLRLGFIGVGGRAQTHLKSAMQLHDDGKVEIVAVCDVFNRPRAAAAEKIYQGTKNKPKEFPDYRELLNDGSIDAVCI